MQVTAKHVSRLRFRRKLMMMLLVCTSVLWGIFLFLNSSLFSVENITVQGNVFLSDKEVLNILNLHPGVNIFHVRPKKIAENAKNHPRLENIVIVKKYPDTLILSVQERDSFAVILDKNTGMLFEVDEQGTVLSIKKDIGSFNLPIITNLPVKTTVVGERIKAKGFVPIKQFLSALNPALIDEISEITLNSRGEIIFYTIDGIKILWGKNEDINEKVLALQALLPGVREKIKEISYVDLRYGHNPIVKLKVGDIYEN